MIRKLLFSRLERILCLFVLILHKKNIHRGIIKKIYNIKRISDIFFIQLAMWIIHLTRQWRFIHKSRIQSRIEKCNHESCFKGGSIPQGTWLAKSLTCYGDDFHCDTVCSHHASNNVENNTRQVEPLVWTPIDVWDTSIIIFSMYDIFVIWYFYCGITKF